MPQQTLDNLLSAEDFEVFYAELEEAVKNNWNDDRTFGDVQLIYDVGQLIQIQDPQYADTVSYFEIEVTRGDHTWVILGVIENYPFRFWGIIDVDEGEALTEVLSAYMEMCDNEEYF